MSSEKTQERRLTPDTPGSRLAQVRRLADLTQAQLAEAIDYDPTHISRIERDQVPMSPKFGRLVAQALGMDYEWLMTGRGQPDAQANVALPHDGRDPPQPVLRVETVRFECPRCRERVTYEAAACGRCGLRLAWA